MSFLAHWFFPPWWWRHTFLWNIFSYKRHMALHPTRWYSLQFLLFCQQISAHAMHMCRLGPFQFPLQNLTNVKQYIKNPQVMSQMGILMLLLSDVNPYILIQSFTLEPSKGLCTLGHLKMAPFPIWTTWFKVLFGSNGNICLKSLIFSIK
jgi:hypothetical protein